MASNDKTKNKIFKLDQINVSNIQVDDIKDGDRIKWGYINYKDGDYAGSLNIQTPFVVSGGVPRIDQYHKDDTERANDIRIIFDSNDNNSNDLQNLMEKIDKQFASKEYRVKLAKQFNSDTSKFDYQPIVKTAKDERVFMKFKLDMNLLKLMYKDNNEMKKVNKPNIDEVASQMKYKSSVRMILKASTMYVSKQEDKYTYGVTFKAVVIEVDPSSGVTGVLNEVFDFDEIDVDKIVVSEIKENERSKAQKLATVNYMGANGKSRLNIKTPFIDIFEGGIPNINEYHKDDATRAKNIKLPFDPNNEVSMAFKAKIEDIDAYFASGEFRQKIAEDIGGSANNYEYQPIMRIAMEPEDDKPKRADAIKAKLDLEYETDKMLTKLQLKKKNGDIVDQPALTVDEMAKHFRYKSTASLVLNTNKLYVKKQADPKTRKKTYGVTLKIISVLVEEKDAVTTTNDDNYLEFIDDNMLDSDDPDVQDNKKPVVADLDDGIEEEEVKPKKKGGKKTKSLDA
jgi:hypothetical protein